jgi:hypothetical protein
MPLVGSITWVYQDRKRDRYFVESAVLHARILIGWERRGYGESSSDLPPGFLANATSAAWWMGTTQEERLLSEQKVFSDQRLGSCWPEGSCAQDLKKVAKDTKTSCMAATM